MQMIWQYITPESLAALCAGAVLTLALALWQWLRMRVVTRHGSTAAPDGDGALLQEESPDGDGALPSVSVIVYAHNQSSPLTATLEALLEQQYAGQWQVVVALDGDNSEDGTWVSAPVARGIESGRVLVSNTPAGSRGISRLKLTLTLGMKAASGDVLLLTTAGTVPQSRGWIAAMATGMGSGGADVTLAYSHPHWDTMTPYQVLDEATVAMQWLGSAIKGRPYRGVGDNLAFTRQAFAQNNGYASNLDLRFGDDDVQVSEMVARGASTRLLLQPHTTTTSPEREELDEDLRKRLGSSGTWSARKLRRDITTSRVLTHRPMLAQGLFSALNYLRLGCLAAAVLLALPNVAAAAVAAALLLVAWWVAATLPMRRLCRCLQAPLPVLRVPLFYLSRPVVNLFYRLLAHRLRNYYNTSSL